MSAVTTSGFDATMKEARRNVHLLTLAQAIMGACAPLSISVGGIAGYQLLGADKSLATAPLTGFNVGVAVGAIGVAATARFLGRKAAFVFGAMVGALGGAVASLALFRSDFWLFALGMLLIGVSGGFTQKIRFAAADASPSSYKPTAISWILAGGIVSAILGPQLSILGKDIFSPITFAGGFLAIIPLEIIAIVVLAFIRLPDMRNAAVGAETPRPLSQIARTPRFLVGMICGIGTYALMTFTMTGAPLAMVVGCGFPTELATLGIQWHVLAMFGPSFFTGMLVKRFGAEKVVVGGLLILMACAVVAHMGVELWNFWLALVLLGIGWNFGFIGATAIVASTYRPHEADKVQGFHDIVLFGAVAMSSFSSGKIFTTWGWSVMNLVIWPVAGLCLLLVLSLLLTSRRNPA